MLTHDQMVAVIEGGGTVFYRGVPLTRIADVPSDEQIAIDAAADAISAEIPVKAQVTATIDPAGLATSAKQDTSNAALGAPADAAVTDPSLDASLTALGKGQLDSLQSILETLGFVFDRNGGLIVNVNALGVSGQKTMINGLPVTIASDQSPVPTTDNGPAWVPMRLATQSADMTTAAAITGAPTTGKTIYADDLLISSDTAMKFTIQMETSGNVLAAVYLAAGGTAQIMLRDGLLADAIDKKLFGKASVAGNVAIYACWHSV